MLRLIRSVLFFAFFVARAASEAQSRRGRSERPLPPPSTFITAVIDGEVNA